MTSPKTLQNPLCYICFCALILPCASYATSMQPLTDTELSETVGRDGLAVSLETDGPITADELRWEMDAQNAAQAASLILKDLSVDWAGKADFTLDVASDASGNPYVMLTGSWSDLQARIGGMSHSGAPNSTMGSLAINTSGSFLLVNQGGPFNSDYDQAILNYTSEGDIFWRQRDVGGAPELGLLDFVIGVDIPRGTVGLNDEGIFISAAEADFDLTFDLSFAPTTTNPYDKGNHDGLVHTGWRGNLRNASLNIASGGAWQSSTGDFYNLNDRTQGLNTDLKLDFGEDFVWIIGQPHQARARAEFSGWQRLGAETGFNGSGQRTARPGVAMADHDFRLPLTLDALRLGDNPGGICFGGATSGGALTAGGCGNAGGDYVFLAPDDNTLAMLIRDAGLHAYNTSVEVWEREYVNGAWGPHSKTDEFNWSLLYTFGQFDGNIFMRPEEPGSDVGFRADVVLGFQSPGYWHAAQNNFADVTPGDPASDPRARWATNTHFMIADTDAGDSGFGIGLINADVLWRVEDLSVRLVDPSTASTYLLDGNALRHTLAPGVWLETDRKGQGVAAQYNFRGVFGGGDLANLEAPVVGLLLDVNLETDRFVFVLGANGGQNYVPFEGLFDFNGNAYLSIAEPSVPTAAWRIHNVEGALLWKDGRIELKTSQETSHGRPELSISNYILLGDTAIENSVLRGDISLGANDNFGSIAIPSGVVYSSVSIRPQN
ncbi:MAG: hypothetical protein LAT61_04760 [Alcanivorax sp.]|nr:hypothetical protein [Alcanivorax sp.]